MINYFFLLLLLWAYGLFAIDLLVKIPTRTRPKQFFEMLDIYYEKLSGEVDCAFLITVDIDDLSMNNDAVRSKLNTYPQLYYYFGENKSKVEAYNKDIDKHSDFKVLLVASDDMLPRINGYDKIIMQHMIESFPDFDGVLNFNDGHLGAALNTMPVIGKTYYERFGYVYHPSYIAFNCDNELTVVSRLFGKEKICSEVIIEHLHPAWGTAIMDELYRKNDRYFIRDGDLYKERLQHNFYLEEALCH